MDGSLIKRLVQFDQERRSFPGEHWFALAAGLWFLRKKGGSLPARLTAKAVGAALVFRAASGRDGLRRLIPNQPAGRPFPGATPDRRTSIGGTSNGSTSNDGTSDGRSSVPGGIGATTAARPILPPVGEPVAGAGAGASPRAALLQPPGEAGGARTAPSSPDLSTTFPDIR
jgi:hypothetical protein